MEALRNRPHRTAVVLAIAVALAAGALGATAPARAATAPMITDGPVIEGTAQEGATLTARATWTGDPAPTVSWAWARCAPLGSPCTTIAGADAATYAVGAADVGAVLVVRLVVENPAGRSERQAPATAVVTAAPAPGPPPPPGPGPAPAPAPAPSPAPAPAPAPVVKPEANTLPSTAGDSGARTPAFDLAPTPAPTAPTAPAAPVAAGQPPRTTRAPMLTPFPVIRIKGRLTTTGAWLTLFTVSVPRRARVTVLCHGVGCPLQQLARVATGAPMHLRIFERALRQGTRLDISISRPGYIGKSTLIAIPRGRAPTRRDECLVPGRAGPAPCPMS
jgi:hypothetical protein